MPRSTESGAPIVPIIGGGPAGMSCALWLHNYGMHPVIIEKEGALGGMARLSPYPNEWLLGQRGKSGRENAAEFAGHIRDLAVETWLGGAPQRLPRAQPVLVERLRRHQASGMATVMAEHTVDALDDGTSRVRVRLDGGGDIEVDHVVLLFGYRPNTNESWLAELALATDALGYLVVDGNMETSCRGVFAVGDVSNPAHPCIATAIGSGTVAARTIEKRLARER